jgi:hypothetical protein
MAGLLGLACAGHALEAVAVDLPADLVPAGWQVHERARGDLNADGRADWVLTLSREEGVDRTPLLLVYLTRSDGGMLKAIEC